MKTIYFILLTFVMFPALAQQSQISQKELAALYQEMHAAGKGKGKYAALSPKAQQDSAQALSRKFEEKFTELLLQRGNKESAPANDLYSIVWPVSSPDYMLTFYNWLIPGQGKRYTSLVRIQLNNGKVLVQKISSGNEPITGACTDERLLRAYNLPFKNGKYYLVIGTGAHSSLTWYWTADIFKLEDEKLVRIPGRFELNGKMVDRIEIENFSNLSFDLEYDPDKQELVHHYYGIPVVYNPPPSDIERERQKKAARKMKWVISGEVFRHFIK